MTTGSPQCADKIYALNAGIAIAPERAMYTPGHGVGEPIALCCNAYLIKHGEDWLLWDTGMEDTLINHPGGMIIAHEIRGIVIRTIADQLNDIGLRPADITKVCLSHAHFDHVGNARLFSRATWYMQQPEYAAMFGPEPKRYGYIPDLYNGLRDADTRLLNGDYDVFGDGAVTILSTPGHTPGHSSMLVRLRRAGPIVLSGDVAHFEYAYSHCCVPGMNANKEASKLSMQRVKDLVSRENAKLWLNHDIVQNSTIMHAPAFYD